MEIEYIARKYGKFLGGINIDKIIESIRRNDKTGVERVLGISVESASEKDLECRRASAMAALYCSELKELSALYRTLLARGLAPADLSALRSRIRDVKKAYKFYKNLAKMCYSPQVRDISFQ